MSQTEQLLRRMTGSITAYMDTVGQRPLRLSDYDRAVLAVQDGELSAFKERYPNALKDHADDLLITAAGRPGAVGRKMTVLLLADVEQFAMDKDYRTLSALVEKGISRGSDAWRTLHMLTCQTQDRWIAEELLKERMWVATNDYGALHACVQNDAVLMYVNCCWTAAWTSTSTASGHRHGPVPVMRTRSKPCLTIGQS